MITNIIVVLVLLSAMILIHEFGHWVVARSLGFQTPIFGFGLPFGGHIKIGKWKETEFRFHWFVLGGYVAIPELGDESAEELKDELPDLKPLEHFPVWKRACVASAGVVFNIIFAFLVCLIMVATIGTPSKNKQVAITDLMSSVKSAKSQGAEMNSIAKEAGFRVGDIILEVNGNTIQNPDDVIKEVKPNKLKPITVKVERTYFIKNVKNKKIIDIPVTPNAEGKIGVGIGLAGTGEYDKPSKNPLMWIYQATVLLIEWSIGMLIGLWLLFANLLGLAPKDTPAMSPDDLHGIVAIVNVFAQALMVDFKEVFRWTALININLAIINLLPIPALDGGHLFFMFIEKLRGRKIADAIQQKAIQAGFICLLALMFFVIFNDIRGIISGKFDLPKEEITEEK